MIFQKSGTFGDFDFSWSGLQLLSKMNAITKLVCTDFFIYTYTSKHKIYSILISRDLKNQKVGPHPPSTTPTTHHQNEKKVSVIKSGILIKYKRINWTPSCKASLLLPGGKVSVLKSEILIKYKNQMDP